MKRLLFLVQTILSLIYCTTLTAQESTSNIKLKVEARADYNHDNHKKELNGLKGNIVDFKLEGDINDRFSYKYRQRLNKPNKDASFFDATDWLYINYKASENISLQAGKWIVAVGCWETEPAPIDVYQLSEFCMNYDCYQWGLNLVLNSSDKQHTLYAQVCQSPFTRPYKAMNGKPSEMWAYNLLWNGNIDFFHTFYSLNLIEYMPGKYINYFASGNRFDISSRLTWDVDLLSRASKGSDLFKDYSIMSQLVYKASDMFHCFAKVSYDVNKTGNGNDWTVHDGTEILRLGAGCEFFPLKNEKVRLHAHYSHCWGKNTNPNGVFNDGEQILNIGFSWKMEILK